MSEQFNMPPPAPPTAPGAPAPSARGPAEQRVSLLAADRACTRCAFNLVGQSIVRESHYGLLIIRCPECGTVASLQEYPLLGRWANRWAALLAGLWFLVITAGTLAVAGVITGFTFGVSQSAAERVVETIKSAYIAHETARGTDPNAINWWWITDPTWWPAQDKRKIIADAGGWFGAIRWRAFAIWLAGGTVLFTFAAAWAVLMSHRRGVRLVLTTLPMILFAMLFWALSQTGGSTFSSVYDLAAGMLWPVVLPMSLACAAVSLCAGVLLGRPLARIVVRAALPPRLRVPLGWLWTCDGLAPPKPI
ncbi:MAG: hypothetical protein KF699_00850 [Phycisphaeraceae bacterium]|nr:hypothetical protein [Phycisphaeraceae bacterium]